MAQSLAKNTIHLVFSTKNRRPQLGEALQPRLHAYLAGILQNWDSPAIVVGGYHDHIHALFVLSKNHSLSKVVEEIKKNSSKWIKTLDEGIADFAWQAGYGAFSVSESNLPEVIRYIENQAAHHRQMTFQDELRELLKRHGIEADEQFLWS